MATKRKAPPQRARATNKPKGARPKKAATKKAATKKIATKKTASKKTASKKTASKKIASKKTATKKAATKKAATKKTASKKIASKKTASKKPQSPPAVRPVAPPPSEPARAAARVASMLPVERALTPLEQDAMRKVATLARAKLSLLVASGPDAVAEAVARFIDDARVGRRPAPKGNDLRLGLGVLWGEQVRARAGWDWVHLAYPDGFAAYALVPRDRGVCCFPLVRVNRLLDASDPTTALRALYELIVTGDVPARRPGEYLVLG
ncbi:MAG: hypothetical protein KC657_19400 [Myxococcales bacterium]|nr:hypothetical protein [Myxococcales bacterium]